MSVSASSLEPISYEGLFYSGAPVLHELSNNSFNRSNSHIRQDKYGKLWGVNTDGLRWFDGYNNYAVKNTNGGAVFNRDNIKDFIYDQNHGFWGLTWNGALSYYDIDSHRELKFASKNSVSVSSVVYLKDQGRLLVSTNDGFRSLHISGADLKIEISNIIPQQSAEHMYLMGEDIYYSSGKSVFKVSIKASSQASLVHTFEGKPGNILVDNNRSLWAVVDKTLLRIDVKGKQKKWNGYDVVAMIALKNGDVWVSALGIGVTVFSADDGRVLRELTSHSEKDISLGSDYIRSIYEDQQGLIWLMRFNDRVLRINNSHHVVSNIAVNHRRSDEHQNIGEGSIYYILRAKNGDVWLGHSSGGFTVLNHDGSVKTRLEVDMDLVSKGWNKQLPKGAIYAMAEAADGAIWFSKKGEGILKLDVENKHIDTVFSTNFAPDRYFNLLFSELGDLFFSGTAGVLVLSRLDGKVYPVLDFSGEDLSPITHHMFADNSNNVWAAGAAYIAMVPDGSRAPSVIITPLDVMNQNPDLNFENKNPKIDSLFYDGKAKVYFLCDRKLFHIQYNAEKKLFHYRHIPLSRPVTGRYLASGNKLLSSHKHANIDSGEVTTFGKDDGFLPSLDNYFAKAWLPGNILLSGSPSGLIVERTDKFSAWDLDVPMVVTNIEIGGEPYTGDQEKLVLQADVSNIVVEVSALDYSAPEKLRYAFRMIGYQDSWVESDYRGRRLNFSNIPAGNYTLEVKGSNRVGKWGSKPLNIAIQVLPKWYETLWFRLCTVLLLLGFLWLLYLLRVRQLKQRQLVLEAVVDQRTSELERSLSDLKIAQVQLVESEKHASLGRLVKGVSHELNTPIGILYSSNSLINELSKKVKVSLNDGSLTQSSLLSFIDSVFNNSELLRKNIERMANLTSRFKESLLYDETNECSQIDLSVFLQDFEKVWVKKAQEQGVQIKLVCPAGLVLKSYSIALKDVLNEIVENCLDHAFDEAASRGLEGQSVITIKASAWGNGGVKITIADNGSGISQGALSEIFEPFYTSSAKAQHIGLGLHSVINRVNQTLHGKVFCRSAINKGSVFVIQLSHST